MLTGGLGLRRTRQHPGDLHDAVLAAHRSNIGSRADARPSCLSTTTCAPGAGGHLGEMRHHQHLRLLDRGWPVPPPPRGRAAPPTPASTSSNTIVGGRRSAPGAAPASPWTARRPRRRWRSGPSALDPVGSEPDLDRSAGAGSSSVSSTATSTAAPPRARSPSTSCDCRRQLRRGTPARAPTSAAASVNSMPAASIRSVNSPRRASRPESSASSARPSPRSRAPRQGCRRTCDAAARETPGASCTAANRSSSGSMASASTRSSATQSASSASRAANRVATSAEG